MDLELGFLFLLLAVRSGDPLFVKTIVACHATTYQCWVFHADDRDWCLQWPTIEAWFVSMTDGAAIP